VLLTYQWSVARSEFALGGACVDVAAVCADAPSVIRVCIARIAAIVVKILCFMAKDSYRISFGNV